MRTAALAITLTIPPWALILVGGVRLFEMASRGALPVLPHDWSPR